MEVNLRVDYIMAINMRLSCSHLLFNYFTTTWMNLIEIFDKIKQV